ncbi:glucans biosynthesis glucosyltransferase MdoH [Phaeobacter sp. PT47_59]|uniref:glucans biosynthesis glucosyltransferase MdoH n=1 Tax=Phaeobacter sp. PT47_59 TaxID=3029979 RepID=UPI002380A393|nr:glucans biosynthesis glucosyltransferase MdoH [Phaeobacter sp. PT47_59]MDE4172837.1 glucans biosynthesis glucosyltransferase MdoH [Phaeobacter sp. PT47_59]
MKDIALLARPNAGDTLIPPEQPLEMPDQDFATAFRDHTAPQAKPQRQVALWRLIAFSPAMIATAGLSLVMQGWFAKDGFMGLEVLLLVLIAFNFFWISFSVSTVLLGLFRLWRRQLGQHVSGPDTAEAMKVALLVPVHNEDPASVCANARTMLDDLYAWGGQHDYAMFILSDTRDDRIGALEQHHVEVLQTTLPPGIRLYYRRRAQNTGRKAGNIADWVRRWGAGYEAMLVLDADSLMTGRAIAELADALARDPGAGLIQSFPQLIEARSVFGRMQQFANGVYGLAMAEGLAAWVGSDGNYWGHNAILRTRAFAACAGLPPLRRLVGGATQIMSHDFVEAGLMRRAGWSVQFMPWIEGSYEETPQTLIDHILRDRRWCQGNLQHLNLLAARGFKAVSRFHLLHGAIGYLMAPIWFALLVIWALIGKGKETSALEYFSPANPLRPSWPDMSEPRHVAVILVIYAMLLAPKILAIVAVRMSGRRLSDFGGAGQFTLSFLSEILLAILYAPILMVQQMIAVFRSALRLQRGWAPQARDGGHYRLRTVALTHVLETLCGLLLSAGIVAGLVSLWLVPIAISLALAIPLSALSGLHPPASLALWMGSRETFVRPQIIETAQGYRRAMAAYFSGQSAEHSAAE